MYFIAIEIGGSKLQVVAGTSTGEIVERRRYVVDRAAGGEGIRAQISEAVKGLMKQWEIVAIGVGYGGPVDWRTGKIVKSYHISGWDGFALGSWLRDLSDLPTFVDNDANVAALGEAHHGGGRGYNPVFWLNSGSGVGGGLVVDGRLYHGALPGEMEIGHMRLDRNGAIVENLCSGWTIDRRIQKEVAQNPNSILAALVKEAGYSGDTEPNGEAKTLTPALDKQCPVAELILGDAANDMAFALSHVTHLVHPEIIVIGGGISLLGEPLRSRLETALPRWLMDAFHPGPKIALASLKEDAVPVGALVLAAMQ